MATPLSPATGASLNATPPTALRRTSDSDQDNDETPSSPFEEMSPSLDRENAKRRSLMPVSPINGLAERNSLSPMKFLTSRAGTAPNTDRWRHTSESTAVSQTPEDGMSNDENAADITLDIYAKDESPTATRSSAKPSGMDDTQFDDEEFSRVAQNNEDFDDDTLASLDDGEHHDGTGMDDTQFSAFSAVPDMTMFAKMGQSPSRFADGGPTPRRAPYGTPTTARQQARHSYQPRSNNSGDTTNLLLDFTEQFNNISNSPMRRHSPSKSQTMPDILAQAHNARTPSRARDGHRSFSPAGRMSNLLDFDIPPAPTPRSMPSITPRELESLKSGFLSEISSLKASLSGKEAEVMSLKTAVGDAEKRVGESMEQVREERDARDQLEVERESWEKRGREMELILRNVREEIVHTESEREALEGRLIECEQRREAAEMMHQEAESRIAALRAGSSATGSNAGDEPRSPSASAGKDVEIAVEKVARELHTLYKSKHETKVAALKKSYESRWDKKVKALEDRVEALTRECDELRNGRDATVTGATPRMPNDDFTEELKAEAANSAKLAAEMEAKLCGAMEEINIVKQDNTQLREDLEKERVEKGDLVAAVEEMFALQASTPAPAPAPTPAPQSEPATQPVPSTATTSVETRRGSGISRTSSLRAPSSTRSDGQQDIQAAPSPVRKSMYGNVPSSRLRRPGGGVPHERTTSTGLKRPGSGLGNRGAAP